MKVKMLEKKHKNFEKRDKQSVKIFAPATVTNVGCGFDVLGFALDFDADHIELRITNQPGEVSISVEGENSSGIPVEPHRNTAGIPILQLKKDFGIKEGLQIKIHKFLGIGSGLGSSAASAVGSVVAMNDLFDLQLTRRQLLYYAAMGEAVSSEGATHIDNIAAALYGGVVFIHDASEFDIIPLPHHENIRVAVLYPHLELKTSTMRRILKENIPLSQAVTQWANLGAFLISWYERDYALMQRSLKDVIVEPIRSQAIPHYERIKNTAMEQGALGCNISGSGPSVFALCIDEPTAQNILNQWTTLMDEIGIESTAFVSGVKREGAKTLKRENLS